MNAKGLLCSPSAFKIPDALPRKDGLALLMPFDAKFDAVYKAIKGTAERLSLQCRRADDLWNDSAIINDIFELIYHCALVVCDCTGRNPNVFYEVGIAHTLGREVIPITQHADDVPFDLRHLRFLMYLPNDEGLAHFGIKLEERIRTIMEKQSQEASSIMNKIWHSALSQSDSNHQWFMSNNIRRI